MKNRREIKRLLKNRILVLDGATGTEFEKQGMPAGVSPELWCLENPEAVRCVHAGYRDAGSDIIYTCTLGANRLKLCQYNAADVKSINRELARLARNAGGGKILVAGDIGPTGHFVEPFGSLPFEEAVDIFKEQIEGLIEGGVDLLILETMMDIQEARAALIAARETADIYTIVTMTFEKDGRTLNGTDPLSALITLQSLGADAVGANCSTGPEDMLPFLRAMKPYATVPLVAKPNAGIPRLERGETVFDMEAEVFASYAEAFASIGVNMIGGCCGTTPRHIAALRGKIDNCRPVPPVRKSISAISSARKSMLLQPGRPLVVIGEGINPTGKKSLQEELREGKTSLIRQMAKNQEKDGADLLDVNVGVPGINEPKTMVETINLLSVATDLPLVIDSAKTDTIAKALRIYPGRALINSISGEAEKLERLLPVAARYGAMFIALPLTEKEVPETAKRRIEIIKNIYKKAKEHGIAKEDMVIDGLVLTAASKPAAPLETLKTIEWSSGSFKSCTVVGLSNVSFGLPERKWINASFLAMAVSRGLTMAIANPSHKELMFIRSAAAVLANRDRDAASYIAFCSGHGGAEKREETPLQARSPGETASLAVLEGNRDDIIGFVKEALNAGISPSALVQDFMVPAIMEVGDLFGRKEYFLPQLIASAEAMKKALDYLEPYLKNDRLARVKKGLILLATVEGDIHDIGKNIVALMLRNHGYEVVDLGKDVPAPRIIQEVKLRRPQVVGLSALMTTTMVRMKEVIDLARKENLSCPFIVGGAAVTGAYARSIGAEYAKDGVEAARTIEKMTAHPGDTPVGGSHPLPSRNE